MNITKRAAAVALSAGLGLGIAGLAAPHAFAAPVPVEFRNDQGVDGTRPQYATPAHNAPSLTSFGSLYTQAGQPIANRTVTVYLFTNQVRGERLGSGTTNAAGAFRFDSRMPRGWSDQANFNVQIAFDDADDSDGVEYASVNAVLRPIAAPEGESPSAAPTSASKSPSAKASTATKKATKKPTKKATATKSAAPSKKDKSGGLAKTGASLG